MEVLGRRVMGTEMMLGAAWLPRGGLTGMREIVGKLDGWRVVVGGMGRLRNFGDGIYIICERAVFAVVRGLLCSCCN